MWVSARQVYLLLLVGTFHFSGCVSGVSLFSENSTLAAVYNVIENALESVNLANIIPSLLNQTENPDQHLSAVIQCSLLNFIFDLYY
jgi:hypothetical protein